ncbi:MAG: energy-coupling factor ABC transporter ATP-binding protein [Bacillota bacterium]|nr:energy-coupling factor ABC transporter ATP-binding protein [Bacillota bacterium]
MFKLENVKFKNILSIDDFQIADQKVTCIIGKSGSGKSTLVKMLNKMLSPDSGKIYYKGQDLDQIDSIDLRRQVIMANQNPAIYKGTVRDNLLIGLKFSEKEPVPDQKLEEILKDFQVIKGLDEDIENLSGGEKQRIALARLLLMDGQVLILDEPSSALDQDTEGFVMNYISSYIKDHKKTLIIVTHSKKLVEDFADEIVEIKEGRPVSHDQ